MVGARYLTIIAALAVAAPAAVQAQQRWGLPGSQVQPRYSQSYNSAAYGEGYQRGLRAGQDDVRRGESFNFLDETDYRRADAGYRSQYGSRDRYRDDFRVGFEAGYRAAFDRNGYNQRYGPPGPPPWSNGRARGRGSYGDYGSAGGYGGYGNYNQSFDLAFDNGYNDGYEQGLKDGQSRHSNDPFAESWYRNGTRGYTGRYGPKDTYRINYRQGFRQGYERGYASGRSYR